MSSARNKILFISHDASRTGAPMALLNLIKWIRANSDLNFRIILRAGGALESEFRALGETHILNDACGNPAFVRDVSLIFSNTCTNGEFIETLPYGTIPIITHVHEMQAVIESYGPANLRRVQKQTAHFIACSKAVQSGLIKLGVSQDKISTIHSSIPTVEVVAKAAEKSREQLQVWHQWEKYQEIVVGCGVAEWRKGADLFVQIAHAVRRKLGGKKNILFLWIGILPPDERGTLLANDVHQLDLEDMVHFLGEQTNPYPYLSAADLFCLSSREDPFPLVMLEAAALGKPIVCFQHAGGGEEFCNRGGGVAVPFLDINAMADAILRLLEKNEIRKDLGAAAAKLVATNFDFLVTAPKFLCEIEKQASKASSPDIGYAQVYFPSADGYSESNSRSFRVPPGRWIRLQVDLPQEVIGRAEPIFLDPIAQPGLIGVTGITFKSKAGKILWRCKSEEPGYVQIPTGVSIPCSRVFKFVCFDAEARLAITIPPHCRTENFLTIEWWQHVSIEAEELALACRDLRDSLVSVQAPVNPNAEASPELEDYSASGEPVKNSKTLRFIEKLLKT
ncbi:MAG: glycosyltransferase [Verrucomicrobia bacterium]|nr:glycosyltransferase [Verrucomicrobiota bacterium]